MKHDKQKIISDSPQTTNKKSKQLENSINQAIKVAQSPEALCEQSNKQNEPVKLTFDADVYEMGAFSNIHSFGQLKRSQKKQDKTKESLDNNLKRRTEENYSPKRNYNEIKYSNLAKINEEDK